MTPLSLLASGLTVPIDFRINIESFAKVVSDYLATGLPVCKVIFLVDGGIGANSAAHAQQTITEQLGTQSEARPGHRH